MVQPVEQVPGYGQKHATPAPYNPGHFINMAQGQHDTIAYRLSQILIKLNQGDHLDPDELADEFGVHVRTIQRDLKVRLAYLPLLKTRGRYHLEVAYLGKLKFEDIERFATLAGVKGLFPSLNRDALRELLAEQIQPPWLVRGHHYEDLSDHQNVFRQLEDAILKSCPLSLELKKDGQIKSYRCVHPYRLVNTKGIWYLAAVHDGKLKTFGVGKIHSVQMQEPTFSRDPDIEASIQNQEGIWHSVQAQKVLLSVSPEAASYFKRRQLIPHQRVLSEASDSTLTVETTVGHPNQILPIVRYWVPHIRIISPSHWQQDLEIGLSEYLSAERS
jgi:predicted DNA-binding transcriptional regulator YafY